jgi:alpha-glucosidase
VYETDRPEVHEILQTWRRLADEADPGRLLVGECFVFDLAALARFYGSGDELHLGFNFPFFFAPFSAGALATVVASTETALPADAWPVYAASNHDGGRLATRWCEGDERKIRCALLALLTLRGTPFLYYGDEIGMPDVAIPTDRVLDPVGRRGGLTRDRCRTPMHWSAEPGAGFTDPGVEPWLPLGDFEARNVAAQQGQSTSTLTFVRDAIALRRGLADLRLAPYSPIETGPDTWVWRRGELVTVALNLGPTECEVEGIEGSLCLSTTRERENEEIRGRLRLAPFEGAVVVG